MNRPLKGQRPLKGNRKKRKAARSERKESRMSNYSGKKRGHI